MYDSMSEIHKRVSIDKTTECWEWIKSTTSAGYGQFKKDKKYWTAHRYSYAHSKGDLLPEELVRHLCNNRKCCNPDHLEKGTHKDNWKDSEAVYREVYKLKRKIWIIGDKTYNTLRECSKITNICQNSILKFTDKETRIFNLDAYRTSCKIAGWEPKI